MTHSGADPRPDDLDLDWLSTLHVRSFTRPRPWSAAEFASLLKSKGVFLLTAPAGFLLGRITLDEAELLTLAVDPAHRRAGIARHLVDRFVETARGRGAAHAFLEVAADNTPARALYLSGGWQEKGRRRGYYGPDLDALVMVLPLGQTHAVA